MARTVVVTGGGTGIGRAVAERFVAAGDEVWLVGRRPEVVAAAAAELGARGVAGDLSDPDEVARVAAALPDRIDVLVANAGGARGPQDAPPGPAGPLHEVARDWWANWSANVLTAVLTTAALQDRMPDGGRVVGIGSIAGARGSGSYGAAKRALESWAIGAAAALGPRGVTVNLVAPGLTEGTEFFGDRLPQDRRRHLVAETMTGRAGTVDDIAAAVEFLASARAGHVTAQVLHVNGGALASR